MIFALRSQVVRCPLQSGQLLHNCIPPGYWSRSFRGMGILSENGDLQTRALFLRSRPTVHFRRQESRSKLLAVQTLRAIPRQRPHHPRRAHSHSGGFV